jgi:hypothetical protein
MDLGKWNFANRTLQMDLCKRKQSQPSVIPAQAGTQTNYAYCRFLDSRLRGNDAREGMTHERERRYKEGMTHERE